LHPQNAEKALKPLFFKGALTNARRSGTKSYQFRRFV